MDPLITGAVERDFGEPLPEDARCKRRGVRRRFALRRTRLGIGAQGNGRGVAPIFELDRGCVSFGADAQLLVPAGAIVALCRAAGGIAARELGRSIGQAAGRRLGGRLGAEHTTVFAEAADALGAELGWLGLGLLVMERWGRALVLRIDGGPLVVEDPRGDERASSEHSPPGGGSEAEALVVGLIEGALDAWTGRAAHATVIDRTPGRLRVLVGGARAAELARELVADGADHHDVLRRLHGAGRSRPDGSRSRR